MRRHRRRVVLHAAFAAVTAMASAALLGAAALVPAPPAVLPLVAVICIGSPMLGAWELARLRGSEPPVRKAGGPMPAEAIAELRRALDQLPETRHPLGF